MKSDTNNCNTFGKLSEEFAKYAMDKEMHGGPEDYTEIFSYIDKMLKEHYEFNSQEELDHMVHEYEHNLAMQGLTLDMFFKYTNSDEKQLREQMRNDAETRVKYRFMLDEIANLEKIEISDKEANEEAEKQAKRYNVSKDEFLSQIGGLEVLKSDLRIGKAIEVIKK